MHGPEHESARPRASGGPTSNLARLVKAAPAGAALAFFLVIIAQWSALQGWWLYDDPQLVIEGISQSVRGTFFEPSEYRHLAAHTFTPLLVLSFKADAAIAGVSPRAFYLHQLLALALAAAVLHVLLLRFVSPLHALLATVIFAFSWQVTYAARTLMIRHYVEGLVCALAALTVWTATRRPWLRDGAASALYLLALLSKEIFAPLPLLFFVLSLAREPLRRAIARMILPTSTLAAFVFWRWKMIGFLGSYTERPTQADLLALPNEIWKHHLGPADAWFGISVSILAAVVLLAWLRRGAAAAAVILAAAVVVILPVVPLAKTFEWRYSFGATAVIITCVAIAAARGLNRRGATIVLLLLACATAVTSVSQRAGYEQLTRQGVEREGRYLWSAPAAAGVLAATAPEWYLQGIAWLREYSGRGMAPRFITSHWAISARAVDSSVVVVMNERGTPVPATALSPGDPRRKQFGSPAEWAQRQAMRDDALPLTVAMSYDSGEVRWQLGPMPAEFIFVTDPSFSASPLPSQGTRRVAQPRQQNFFRIIRVTPNGRWTTTPRLAIPRDGGVTRWTR